MKKITYTFITLITIIVCITFFGFKSGQSNNKLLFLRTIEGEGNLSTSGLILTDGEKTIKTLELNTLKPNKYIDNTKTIAKEINDLVLQGYKLIQTTGGGGSALIVTNYIFEKQ